MTTKEELEWKTRKERVDKKLKSLDPAWTIIKHHTGLNAVNLHCCAVEEYPTGNGPADYALFVKGQLLAIIEAKKVTALTASAIPARAETGARMENTSAASIARTARQLLNDRMIFMATNHLTLPVAAKSRKQPPGCLRTKLHQ